MNPVQRLIAKNPTSAVLETNPATSGDYDPTAPARDPDVPLDPEWWNTLTPIRGAWSGIKVETSDYDATFLIEPHHRPRDAAIANTRLVTQQGDYGIKAIRPRMNAGRINGYTLELSA